MRKKLLHNRLTSPGTELPKFESPILILPYYLTLNRRGGLDLNRLFSDVAQIYKIGSHISKKFTNPMSKMKLIS